MEIKLILTKDLFHLTADINRCKDSIAGVDGQIIENWVNRDNQIRATAQQTLWKSFSCDKSPGEISTTKVT